MNNREKIESREQCVQDLENEQEVIEFQVCSLLCEPQEHMNIIGHINRQASKMAEPKITPESVSKSVWNKTADG